MKYSNAQNILPEDVVKIIQEYVSGEYLYIPRKTEEKRIWGEKSGSRESLKTRNLQIYNNYKNGTSILDLAQEYYLSEKSIQRIIREQKKLMLKISTET